MMMISWDNQGAKRQVSGWAQIRFLIR